MRLLLDTHSILWYVDQDHLLSRVAHAAITDPNNDLLISAASIWEIGIKVGSAKLALSLRYRPWMEKAIADLRADILPVTVEYAEAQSTLPNHHRDPFDRLLIAQSQVERIPVISSDIIFDRYAVSRLW